MPETKIIAQVILWTNGMVATFDQFGEQMPEYQGHYGEVRDKIRAAGYRGRWYLGEWNKGILADFQPDLYLDEL